MFTGIVEEVGKVLDVHPVKDNLDLKVAAKMLPELKVDQSVSHNGVCLTVTKIEEDGYWVTAIAETLAVSNIAGLKIGAGVNLERSMKLGGRLDGHIVQGHVDQVAAIVDVQEQEGSWMFEFAFQADGVPHLLVEKGSITVNGVSLTCFDIGTGSFKVAIIPYTYGHTTFKELKLGAKVNLEFDIIGKYVAKMQGLAI